MKKVLVNKLRAKNMFKITIYLTILPFGIMGVIGLFMTIIGAAIDQPPLLFMGISYIVMPVFLILIYGLLAMLNTVIYNKLSGKFGGMELYLTEEEKPTEE
ncbi:hypothetical protein ACSVDE_13510 [Pseudalkalibacillus sp. Hm43]|uniref:hypothetical protein n=1 Tax=Pseudalkalibacillus sp. Hm43 TaxID=3450742 RepID=UPI003F423965